MSWRVLLTFSLLSAATLALVYRPVLAKLSVGLASPYAKADVTKRFCAAVIDASFAALMLFPYGSSESVFPLFIGAAFLLLRDAVHGRSAGKLLCGLVVIDLETGQPCGWRSSVRRNVLLALPGANVAAAFMESSTIVRDPLGYRLGDRLAMTQVVEGFGVRDLARAIQEWWLNFIGRRAQTRTMSRKLFFTACNCRSRNSSFDIRIEAGFRPARKSKGDMQDESHGYR